MAVYSLAQRRFESAKQKVHDELVDYFVNVEGQRKLWYLTAAINNNARTHQFTQPQAEQLVESLVKSYDIRRANIESAVAFNPARSNIGFKNATTSKIVVFQKGGVLTSLFEQQINALYEMIQKRLLEFRQALELVLILLSNYPAAQRVCR